MDETAEDITATQETTRSRAGRYLTFNLGSESYGISVLKVREIIQMQKVTRVPCVPEYVKGVINLRGKVIPVVDLRLKFDFGETEVSKHTCIIVVAIVRSDGSDALTGLIVDAVEEVLHIEAGQIENTPGFSDSSISMEYIDGIAKIRDTVAMLLDIDQAVAASVLERIVEDNQP
ncbi:chemotaxis protein CheW [Ruficoccus amylovorans]|uniref:Chemotaxis protein CheW n=1 Tax=Ruficoccus amylovorans TaxID=1804625 RepID=A0A842HIE7_9BACT|nr:chemotaxis protein CheW [Ruficoccus amylovorans]MBC2594991.1 chemotaxis protein CheW [Ruficoccus amylovorans]